MVDHRNQEAPDIRFLSESTRLARVPHVCDRCKETIEPGNCYQTSKWIEDGKLIVTKSHVGGYRYPSGCPKFAARDLAELADQFAKDRDDLFVQPEDLH